MAATEVGRVRIPVPSKQVELIVLNGAASNDTVLTSLETPGYVIIGEFGIGGALNADTSAGYTLSGQTITLKNISAIGAAANMILSLLVIGG